MATRIRTLEALQNARDNLKNVKPTHSRSNTASSFSTNVLNIKCVLCNGKHYLFGCDSFKHLSSIHKKQIVKEKHLCFNCLKSGHGSKNCRNKKNCLHCNKRHHSLIHPDGNQKNNQVLKGESDKRLETSNKTETDLQALKTTQKETNYTTQNDTVSLNHIRGKTVLLATAKICVIGKNGKKVEIRALLDQGSEVTFITGKVVQMLSRISRKCKIICKCNCYPYKEF